MEVVDIKFLKEETLNLKEMMKKHNIGTEYIAPRYVFFKIINYQGIETHQLAAIKGLEKMAQLRNIVRDKRIELWAKQDNVTREELLKSHGWADKFMGYSVIPEAMEAEPVDPTDFFKEYQHADDEYEESYCYAFISPPSGENPTGRKDFKSLNQLLFPNQQDLIIYRWNDDWSDYFNAGKEWWGTFYWTIYDPSFSRMTVIGASKTD
ncbi:hypothetical protein [Isobaculum melis]|uniref:Uncharacterized protein n=1 Tax=Isobaculum melis TaxID=142588 RepID=A0A1H9QUL7_9LACT|nr:hypothetical protein [Isobaculum melis]SER64130.1 hypothetical protein SAMN04488559_102295 [Isobaculum melis]